MPKKRPDHLREIVGGAKSAKPLPEPQRHDTGEGGAAARRPPPNWPADCPAIALGMHGNLRFYLDKARQLIALPVGKHTTLELMGLYGTDVHLLEQHFPRYGQKGYVNGVEARAAQQAFLAESAKNIWSPTEKARGRGCWPGADGSLIVNTGTAVFAEGRWQSPGLFADYALIGREAIMRPSLLSEPGGRGGAAAEVLALIETWPWKRPLDARLLLGLIVCGFLGAAIAIRPVGWIIGPKGSGKSTLQTAIADLTGGWFTSVLDPTPASIWQTLKYDCLAFGIDEAETDEDQNNKRRLQELVRLARLCFSGGKLPRGGADGEATEYTLRSSVLFSSINRPSLTPQDRSRMIIMQLLKLLGDRPPPDLSRQRLRALGSRLLRRAIDGFPRLGAALAQYRIALREVGHEGRSLDVFGMALAAADIVLHDALEESDSAAQLAGQIPYATLLEAEDDLSTEAGWLQWLLSNRIPLDGTGDRDTIAGWLRRAVKATNLYDRQQADSILGQYGLKVRRPKSGGEPTQFCIATRGKGLEELHADTQWAGRPGEIGGWHSAARELPDAEETTQQFGDNHSKGTAIPLRLAFPNGYSDAPAPREAELEIAR